MGEIMIVGALHLVVYWIGAMTPLTWAAFRWDKWCARHGARRVPERTLLRMAALGGILGAYLGMYAHRGRHKTGKEGFKRPLHAIMARYVGVACVLVLLLLGAAYLHAFPRHVVP